MTTAQEPSMYERNNIKWIVSMVIHLCKWLDDVWGQVVGIINVWTKNGKNSGLVLFL